MDAELPSTSVEHDNSQKWYNLVECTEKDVSNLSDAHQSDVTDYPTSYESDLLTSAVSGQEKVENWYALSTLEADSSSKLVSPENKKPEENKSVSLSPWLYPIASQGSTSYSSDLPNSLGTVSQLSSRLQSAMDFATADGPQKIQSRQSSLQNLNSSASSNRPDPLGQSSADTIFMPSILPSHALIETSNDSAFTSISEQSHVSCNTTSSHASKHSSSESEAAHSSHINANASGITKPNTPDKIDVPSRSVPPSRIEIPPLMDDNSKSDSSVHNLLGSNYIVAEQMLNRFRQERFQIPKDVNDQKSANNSGGDEHLKNPSMTVYSSHSSILSSDEFPYLEHSSLSSSIQPIDPNFHLHDPIDSNESHSADNNQIDDEYVESPDLGIASTVTGFSASPKNGRSMHSGISTHSSDSARGYQTHVTDNIDQEIQLENFDQRARSPSILSECSLSTADSFSSELIRLQQSDDSRQSSLPVANQSSINNIVNMEELSYNFNTKDNKSDKQSDFNPDDLIREIHRSLGAGTITPIFSELNRSHSAPSTIDMMNSTTETKQAKPGITNENHPTLNNNMASSNNVNGSCLNDITSILNTEEHNNRRNSSSSTTNVKTDSSTSTATSDFKPRVSPVLPTKHSVGIYDINYSSGPGSTNRRRIYHGKKPLKTNYCETSGEIYVSQGSGESTELRESETPQLSSTQNYQFTNNLPLTSYPQPNRSPLHESDESENSSHLTDDTEVLLKYPSMIAEKLNSYKKSRDNAKSQIPGFGMAVTTTPNSSFLGSKYNEEKFSEANSPKQKASEKESRDINRLWKRFLSVSDEQTKTKDVPNQPSKYNKMFVNQSVHSKNITDTGLSNHENKTKKVFSCQRCDRKDVATNCPTPILGNNNVDKLEIKAEPLMLHAWTQTKDYITTDNLSCDKALSTVGTHEPYSSLYNYRLPPNSLNNSLTKDNDLKRYTNKSYTSTDFGSKQYTTGEQYSLYGANDNIIVKDIEAQRSSTIQGSTLQEAFLTSCHDFIYRSRLRQLKLKERKEQKRSEQYGKPKSSNAIKPYEKNNDDARLPQRVTEQSSRWDYHHKPTKRQVNMKKSIANNKKRYNALPEVINKQQQMAKEARCRTNRLRVKAFDHKVREQLLEKRQR